MNVSLGCVPDAYIAMVIETVNTEISNVRFRHTRGVPSGVFGVVNTNWGCMIVNSMIHTIHWITRVTTVLCNTEMVLEGGIGS